MEHYNLREIRTQLPLGGISEIAERVGVHPSVVSAVFNKGRKGKWTNEILACAVEMIENKIVNPEEIEKAKKLSLTTTNAYQPVHRKRKASRESESFDDDEPVNMRTLYWVAGIGALTLVGWQIFKAWKNKQQDGLENPGGLGTT